MSFPERSTAAVSREGRHARDRGDPEHANPYPEGSAEHATWLKGWKQLDSADGTTTEDDPSA